MPPSPSMRSGRRPTLSTKRMAMSVASTSTANSVPSTAPAASTSAGSSPRARTRLQTMSRRLGGTVCSGTLSTTFASTQCRISWVAYSGLPAESSRRIDLYLDLVPLGVASEVSRIKAKGILVPELECDSRTYFDKLRLVVGVREERASPGHSGDLLENRTPKARKRITGRVCYPNRIDLHIGFFDSVAKLLVRVAAIVVLTVGDYQKRFLCVTALLNFFNSEVSCIIKCGRAARVYEQQVAEKIVSRSGEVLHKLCAIVEADQEEIIVIVRSLDKPAQRANRTRPGSPTAGVVSAPVPAARDDRLTARRGSSG